MCEQKKWINLSFYLYIIWKEIEFSCDEQVVDKKVEVDGLIFVSVGEKNKDVRKKKKQFSENFYSNR